MKKAERKAASRTPAGVHPAGLSIFSIGTLPSKILKLLLIFIQFEASIFFVTVTMESILNILCVDDYPDSVELLRLMLESEGHKVSAALTAEAAIEHIQQQEFDLYVLDLHLPGVDGLDLCRTIRSRNPRVPIILYSAAEYLKDKEGGYEAGATAYLVKPDGLDQLLTIAAGLRKIEKHNLTFGAEGQSGD